VPARPGSEEYLNSEKYEAKERTLDGELLPLAAKLNAIRRANEALQWLDPLLLLETENEQLFAFLKQRGDNAIVTVVNLDPRAEQEGVCVVPASTGLAPAYPVRDLLTDETWTWKSGRNYVKLPPGQSHVLRIGG
jgi:starch synthase (maltosyl-transferring)